ncbi:MAG: SLC13 family permease [Noviherbaspirillum sp.]
MLLPKVGLPSLWAALAEDYLLLALLGVLVLFTLAEPRGLAGYPELVDWPTVATLAGLLVLTKGLELSGALARAGSALARRMPTERALALLLVAATALLATALTNDVALFVMVPLTLALRHGGALPVNRLIAFEALAANAGSVLTPVGNPQNLFLWQRSGLPFAEFIAAMAPLAALLALPLLAMTAAAFSGRRLESLQAIQPPPMDRGLLLLSLGLYLPFLILADLRQAPLGLALLAALFLFLRRQALMQADWSLILVFILMFIDLRLLVRLPQAQAVLESGGLEQPQNLFLAGVAASQSISNVPATILLAGFSRDWLTLAYAVNVGGFGFALGSLANLIALRMARDRQAWITFHAWSVPLLLGGGALAYFWLFWPWF